MFYDFEISKETDLQAFFKMMHEKYPDIIGRKRFCCSTEENTEALKQDCQIFKVSIMPILYDLNEADKDIVAGKVESFDSPDKMLDSLKSQK